MVLQNSGGSKNVSPNRSNMFHYCSPFFSAVVLQNKKGVNICFAGFGGDEKLNSTPIEPKNMVASLPFEGVQKCFWTFVTIFFLPKMEVDVEIIGFSAGGLLPFFGIFFSAEELRPK